MGCTLPCVVASLLTLRLLVLSPNIQTDVVIDISCILLCNECIRIKTIFCIEGLICFAARGNRNRCGMGGIILCMQGYIFESLTNCT